MNCLVLDDEPMALQVIEKYIERTPFLSLSSSFRDALKALDYLHSHPVDLLFIDINMPDLSGLQFLETLSHPPLFIFTTAYSEYAVRSYDLDAVDFLLKPIEFDRFLKAANKARTLSELKNNASRSASIIAPSQSSAKQDFILLKSGKEIHKTFYEDILYVESDGNYVTFVTCQKKILYLSNLLKVVELLPASQFFRVHRSYIISLRRVSKIERHQVHIGNRIIPIGKVYRESFFKWLKTIG